MSNNLNKTKKVITNLLNKSYKYGFKTKIKVEYFPKGLNKKIIYFLSKLKHEPKFILNFRLNAYKKWKKMTMPFWANLNINLINYKNILYYSQPKKDTNYLLTNTFKKLGLDINSNNSKSVAFDIVFDSNSIITTYKEKLSKFGIIFCSISEAIQFYPKLIKKFLGSVVSNTDNFFAALNSIVFTDGSFCYIPQNIKCPLELSTYFRINNINSGQFERTLIVGEKNSSLSYLEGCTASEYLKNQLHAAIVEIISYENAVIKYSTIQNWYSGNKLGVGGIYNFVTKRGITLGKASKIYWTQVETGSSITWKYPSCILLSNYSLGEFYSLSLTSHYQQADTGTKMIHLGKYTRSKIVAKGISNNFSKNSYRGLVKISPNALYSRNFSQCDSFLLSKTTYTCTYPYIDLWNSKSIIEHEAKISKLNEDQLFYIMQRGLDADIASFLLISGFCKEIFINLPMEFALEANKLLSLKLEETIA
jgi:Fe-S cluster assembly protein SufB